MRVLTIANEKGGVGKTTLAYHCARRMAETRRVLAIDLDQQEAGLSTPLMEFASTEAIDLFAEPCEVPSVGPLTLAPRTRQLEALERENIAELAPVFLESLKLNAEHYDAVVIDCPPHFGIRTACALLAADQVICPIELAEASLEGVEAALGTLCQVYSAFNKPLPDFTTKRPLLVNRFDTHSPRQKALFEELSLKVGKIVIEGALVSRDAYARYRAEQKPVWEMRDRRGQISQATRVASAEMLGVLDKILGMLEHE